MASTYIASAFNFSGNLFASVYQALDSHRVRVAPLSSQTQSLASELELGKRVSVSCVQFASQSGEAGASKKRRTDGASQEVLLIGTASGQVLVYNPSVNAVVHTFTVATARIAALAVNGNKCIACTSDGDAAELDMNQLSQRQLPPFLVEPVSAVLSANDRTIVSTASPHLIKDQEIEITYLGFASPIKQLAEVGQTHFAAIGEDRQVLVYAYSDPKPVNTLVCPSGVVDISVGGEFVLAATTDDGKVYIFNDVLNPVRKARGLARTEPQTFIQFTAQKQPLYIAKTQFQDDFLVLVYPDPSGSTAFERVQWFVNNEMLSEPVIIEKQTLLPTARENLANGKDLASAQQYTESQANIASGEQLAHLSDDETLADRLDALEKQELVQTSAEPSKSQQRAELTQNLSQPGSFSMLLSQALKMNDTQLLEVCLEVQDGETVRASIAKLAPKLAASLLEHLAATLAKSPVRSESLMQWIRYTIVVHGGYLVTVPNLLKTLASLHSALTAKAQSLPRLLALLGRLELLEEQLAVRSEQMQQTEDILDEDEAEVVYDETLIVNGEEAADMDGLSE